MNQHDTDITVLYVTIQTDTRLSSSAATAQLQGWVDDDDSPRYNGHAR